MHKALLRPQNRLRKRARRKAAILSFQSKQITEIKFLILRKGDNEIGRDAGLSHVLPTQMQLPNSEEPSWFSYPYH